MKNIYDSLGNHIGLFLNKISFVDTYSCGNYAKILLRSWRDSFKNSTKLLISLYKIHTYDKLFDKVFVIISFS